MEARDLDGILAHFWGHVANARSEMLKDTARKAGWKKMGWKGDMPVVPSEISALKPSLI